VARGWQSKSIEAQQEEAGRQRPKGIAPAPEVLERRNRRHALELTRSRTAADLSRASAPAHRQMLERAIESLDEQIAALAE
jgi:hypothetical protein